MFYGMLGVVLGGRIGYMLFYDVRRVPGQSAVHASRSRGRHELPRRPARRDDRRVAWWSRRQRLHFFDTMDFVAPLVPPGLGFGRLGNYIGGELWGKLTGGRAGAWCFRARDRAVRRLDRWSSCSAVHASGALDAYARHPSQLYQAALEGLVMFVRAVVVFAQAAAALCGVRAVRAAVRRVPLPGRIRARARCAARLPGLRLADHGPGAVAAADRARPVPAAGCRAARRRLRRLAGADCTGT